MNVQGQSLSLVQCVALCLLAHRASSTSPSSQSSKMNSMLYQKQFQSGSAGMRIPQHYAGQFTPQVRSGRTLCSRAEAHRGGGWTLSELCSF